MRAVHAAATGIERMFGDNELIVSKTDLSGRITYANELFVSLSGYSRSELMGAAHSIVRHPDMPRGIFKLLWDLVSTGREVFAFVKNQSKNGDYYWVLAHVTPTVGGDGSIIGYHSNRRTPDRSAIEAIEPVYAVMLAEERRHGKAAGAEASLHVLASELRAHNTSYDDLVFGSAA